MTIGCQNKTFKCPQSVQWLWIKHLHASSQCSDHPTLSFVVRMKHLNAPIPPCRIFNPSIGSAQEEYIAIAMSWFSSYIYHSHQHLFHSVIFLSYQIRSSFRWFSKCAMFHPSKDAKVEKVETRNLLQVIRNLFTLEICFEIFHRPLCSVPSFFFLKRS